MKLRIVVLLLIYNCIIDDFLALSRFIFFQCIFFNISSTSYLKSAEKVTVNQLASYLKYSNRF